MSYAREAVKIELESVMVKEIPLLEAVDRERLVKT
jgi:hypothetical protein